MTPHQAQRYLKSFINHEIHLDQTKSSAFKLERVADLLKNLGDPQDDLKIIHVAGSKGKGSICAVTANILKSSGYKVGLYTSPHVSNFRERIRVLEPHGLKPVISCSFRSKDPSTHSLSLARSGSQISGESFGKLRIPLDRIIPSEGEGRPKGVEPLQEGQHSTSADDIFPDMISEKDLSDCLEEIKPKIEQVRAGGVYGRLSFFEVITALAFYYFRKQQVDFVILETGLGGRLDATNAAHSLIAVIAPISLEHTNILGNTIEEIAGEKAAIIKDRNQKVIIATQGKLAKDVIKSRCSQFDIIPVWVDKQTKSILITQNVGGQVFDLSTVKTQYKQLFLPLLGAHQRDNCAVAVSISECLMDLGYKISPYAISKGIRNVFWPLRFEVLNGDPLVVLDGAHNKISTRVLSGLMKELFNDKSVTLIFGISRDKDMESVLNELKSIAKNIIFTKADHPRARDLPGALSVKEALDLAYLRRGHDDVILVTGSIFVASEARMELKSLISGQCSVVSAQY